MREKITKEDGSEVTFEEAVFCSPGVRHDWVYHRTDKQYKCQLCGYVIDKHDLKYLTD